MMSEPYFKLPRLYINQPLSLESPIELDSAAVHYFRTVLRRQDGDLVRLFNGCDGEFLAELTALEKKKGRAILQERIKDQPQSPPRRHLLFAPLKKNRMDIIIEKAVELGVTDLHPIVTRRTEVRDLKQDRLEKQIIESLEQCERLTCPRLHPLIDLHAKLQQWDENIPLYACIERGAAHHLKEVEISGDCGFIVGPVGGFEEEEMDLLENNSKIKAISLGKSIYRAETACIICLAYADLFG